MDGLGLAEQYGSLQPAGWDGSRHRRATVVSVNGSAEYSYSDRSLYWGSG